MAKSFARTFGQDLMRGEHRVGGGQPVTKAASPKDFRAGTARGGAPDTVRDASFYSKKRELERELERELTVAEFRAHTSASASASASAMALAGGFETANGQSGTSIFDPVLCELSYRWFCPPGGTILDPFAGGSVRGIVASKLGYPYIGVELRPEQVAANMAQGESLCGVPAPRWVCGDSRDVLRDMASGPEPVAADFIFSCPPYADLEVYSDDPRDLSTMPYDKFREAYSAIISGACALLKPNRFACFVVGDVRGKDGNYYGFPWHTVAAFEAAGLRLYNDSVLVTAIGSLPVRVTKQFDSGRKLGKTHQNIFVFLNGNAKKAAQACRGGDGN